MKVNNQEIDIKDVELSKDEIETLVSRYNDVEPSKDKRWKPEHMEKFWYVSHRGEVEHDEGFEGDFECDIWAVKIGNCFKTKEEAQAHLDYLDAIADVTDYIHENDLQKNNVTWDKNIDQSKFNIAMYKEELSYHALTNTQYQSIIPYLKSPIACEQLIKALPEELKLIFK